MHRSLIAAVSVMACVGIVPARAAPVTKATAISGNVKPVCVAGTTAPIVLSSTMNSGTIDPTLQDRSWVIPGWSCNAPSTIRVSSTSLRLNTPKTSLKTGESQAINFSAHAYNWASVEAKVTTGDTSPLGTLTSYASPMQSQGSAKNGTITVKVDDFVIVGTTTKSTPKLIAGTYSARIVLAVVPSI